MKTKLNETEELIAEWIFDGNDASCALEPGEDYLGVSFEKMMEAAEMLAARGLVTISGEGDWYLVAATDAWLKAEGL